MQELGPSGFIKSERIKKLIKKLTFHFYEQHKTVHAIKSLNEKYDIVGALILMNN